MTGLTVAGEARDARREDSPHGQQVVPVGTRRRLHRITDDIVAAIEQGAGEWDMPWHHDGSSIARPRNVTSGKPYRGINILALWVAAHRAGYTNGTWGTYRQWTERGCQVRHGETATIVVFWKLCGRPHNFQSTTVVALSPRRTWAPTACQARYVPHSPWP